MSHSPIIASPPETPMAERSVGELVAERPGRSRIFQSYQIDFCCSGGVSLKDVCESKCVNLLEISEQLDAELANSEVSEFNPSELRADELIRHIVIRHHGFLREELPRLLKMAQRVAKVHGGHTPSLLEVFEVFTGIESELSSHMMKEEQILFPAIAKLCEGVRFEGGSLDGPIECMEHEHEEVKLALGRLRELTNDFQPPAEACNTYRALFAGLQDLEGDLNRHIHLENEVLFPAARELAC